MVQVFQSRINRGLDHFSPLCTADWIGLWQTVQADLQSAPAREEHCPVQTNSDACRRQNRGFCAAGPNCKCRHVCWTCGDAAHTEPACSQHQELLGDEVGGILEVREAKKNFLHVAFKPASMKTNVLYTSRTSIDEPPHVVSQNDNSPIRIPYSLVDTSPPPLADPGPPNPAAWSQWLAHHPDRTYAQTLVDIITPGARVGYTGPCQTILSRNLASAHESPQTLSVDVSLN
jgi:hypothetical protein